MEANFYLSYYDWRKKKHCKNCAKRETSDVTVVLTRLFSPSSLFGFPLIILPTPLSEHMCISQLSLSEPGKTFLLHERKFFFFASPPPIDFLLATSVSVFTSSDWCVCVCACDM